MTAARYTWLDPETVGAASFHTPPLASVTWVTVAVSGL
jgi:hypothetical protein